MADVTARGEIVLHLSYGWYSEDAEIVRSALDVLAETYRMLPVPHTDVVEINSRRSIAERAHELADVISVEIERVSGQTEWRRSAEKAAERRRERERRKRERVGPSLLPEDAS